MAGFVFNGGTAPLTEDFGDETEEEADKIKRKYRLFSELFAEMQGIEDPEEFNKFKLPEGFTGTTKDFLDQFEVLAVTESKAKKTLGQNIITVQSPSVDGAKLKVSPHYVKANLKELGEEDRARAILEMAVIAANHKGVNNETLDLQGSDEERMMLYLAAQQFGFADKINQKNLEKIKLDEAAQQKIQQTMQTVWDKFTKDEGKMSNKDFEKAANDKPAVDTDRVKEDFGQPIGAIMNFYHQKYDKKAVEDVKVSLLALYYYEKDQGSDILPKFKGNIDFRNDEINSVDKLKAFVAANNVPQSYLDKAQEEVDAWKPAPQDFPKMGEIADGYRMTNPKVKNQLLTAQAIVRTMSRVERLEAGTPEVEQDKNKTFFGHLGKFPNDPPELKEAQQLYALATAAEQAKAQGVDLGMVFPDAENMRKSALASLDKVVDNLAELGEDKAADSLRAVRESYAPQEDKPQNDDARMERRPAKPAWQGVLIPKVDK